MSGVGTKGKPIVEDVHVLVIKQNISGLGCYLSEAQNTAKQ
jgi:hypothetical protein